MDEIHKSFAILSIKPINDTEENYKTSNNNGSRAMNAYTEREKSLHNFTVLNTNK